MKCGGDCFFIPSSSCSALLEISWNPFDPISDFCVLGLSSRRFAMKTGEIGEHIFSLTSLQIGDLQSYRSFLTLFLGTESNTFFILVDNRPWLTDLDSRAAHLWQLMVTKSRLSPFANNRARRVGKRCDLKDTSMENTSKPKKFKRWFSAINAVALAENKALFPVKKLGINSELRRTLYGFIVFEVAWTNVRGINYLNELQTDTSMAIEAKFMKKWEFDSIEQASSSISSWFSGSYYECLLLQDYLDSIIGEVFYDAQEFSMNDQTMDRENVSSDDEHFDDQCSFGFAHDFNVYPASVEHTSSLHTPPPPTGSYKRRKIMKSGSFGSKFSAATEDVHHETVSSPKFLGSPRTHGSPKIYDSPRSYFSQSSFNSPRNYGTETFADLIRDSENSIEATQYSDVLILFRFNDRNLPFKLREIIMSDLRLLTLLEAGLPSWVIFVQSYPVFCHLYRPWMCPLVRALYVMISLVTVIIGFYDLYKNVPVLKATASRLCGPLFDWIETWEMVSRIKYLGTMLFLHNFKKAVMWFLLVTRAIRSFASVVAQPMLGPIAGIMGFLFPFWNICLEAVESFYSVVWVATGSSISLIIEVVQIILSPILFILSFIWSFTSLIICPMVWAIWGILYAPIRVVIMLANLVAFVSSSTFDILGDIWLSLKGVSNLASATEATVSTYEVSIWRSLWDDLFSQIFRAVRSIINGFIAFFVACNRHRLSIYNHILEFFRRLSLLGHRSQPQRSGHCRQMYGVQSRVSNDPFSCAKLTLLLHFCLTHVLFIFLKIGITARTLTELDDINFQLSMS